MVDQDMTSKILELTGSIAWYEYRNVGEHDWMPDCARQTCRFCGGLRQGILSEIPTCPSKQERRLIGEWEPVEDEPTRTRIVRRVDGKNIIDE